jgi:hypothetical protein
VKIIRLIGVYDANGTVRGEIAYWIGARLGRRHCSLCEVTHGLFAIKGEWKRCRDGLPIAFDTFHRDDQPDAVRRATGDRAPVVVAETANGLVVLLDGERIEAARGEPQRLMEAIEARAAEVGLAWS